MTIEAADPVVSEVGLPSLALYVLMVPSRHTARLTVGGVKECGTVSQAYLVLPIS